MPQTSNHLTKTTFLTDHCSLFSREYNNFGLKNTLSLVDVRKDLETLGKKFKNYLCEYEKNLNFIDDGIAEFIGIYCLEPKTKEEIKEELEKLRRKDTTKCSSTMCLVDNS